MNDQQEHDYGTPVVSSFEQSLHRLHLHDDDDADTASQRSISLSSAPPSPLPVHPVHLSDDVHEDEATHEVSLEEEAEGNHVVDDSGPSPNIAHEFLSNLKHESQAYTLDTDFSSEPDDSSMYTHENPYDAMTSPLTSAAPSVYGDSKSARGIPSSSIHESVTEPSPLPTYPPTPIQQETAGTPRAETASISSFASNSSRKARPESTLLQPAAGPLVLGIALIDFNHLVGPRIEYSHSTSSVDIFADEEIAANLPFLALPDGAHLSTEDYSYFHLVPSNFPNPTTVFGISCNRQVAASALRVRDADATRSTVQKAVVVLASKPVFGPMRDKLGVVTQALFNQLDFTQLDILPDFAASLEVSLRSQLTESGLYMGTSIRELVHIFRQRTLVLIKALMLQKRIMFYGHPVERLCTYQYSLISLLPGLLQTLEDCGSPPLSTRAATLKKANSLKTSDRKSMMAYLGLPLDVFGKDAFFQPYIPLQQVDMLKDTKSWLCGSTNSIVTGLKEIDLLVNTENGTFEFRDPTLERSAGLTAADRKWMDDIVRDVNEGWNDEDPTRPTGMLFKGSDDYLRTKFEEYVSSALASVRYQDFLAKGEGNGVLITGGSGVDANSTEDFNPLWISEFKKTNAYEVWERTTDSMLFDIVEPRHPCNEKPSVVADIGLRLSEGIQELKLEQQLAPTREAISRTITAGSTNFLKAVEGVRGRWQRAPSLVPSPNEQKEAGATIVTSSTSSTPVEVSPVLPSSPNGLLQQQPQTPIRTSLPSSAELSAAAAEAKAAIGSWGAGIGSFWSAKTARFSKPATSPPTISSTETPNREVPATGHIISPSISSSASIPYMSSVQGAGVEVKRLQPHEEVHDLHIADDDLHMINEASSPHVLAKEDDDDGTAYATGMAV
ncbi:hypothetical protein HWV62_147 [Athelia sp. TMB]|nr:hypothetical protein HWV62_147 [Athelia sp. TMB]